MPNCPIVQLSHCIASTWYRVAPPCHEVSQRHMLEIMQWNKNFRTLFIVDKIIHTLSWRSRGYPTKHKWGRAVSHSTILIYTQLDKPAGYFQPPTPSEITWVTTTINKYTDKITIKMTSDQVLLFTVWDLLFNTLPKTKCMTTERRLFCGQ